jgi:hypothetical protein
VDLATLYLSDVMTQFRMLKQSAERALGQVADADLTRTLDGESNSIAVLMQHMGGNLKSRWTDFLTSDGEKPDRDRDAEFELRGEVTRAALLARWNEGWDLLFATLAALTPADLLKTVEIRWEPHSVPQAIHRQMTHQAYHVGQIVMLCRHYAGPSWFTLSVAKGKSRELNAELQARAAARTTT